MPMLWTTEITIFIRMIAKNFIQHKQPFLWFKEIMIETCYENTTQTTTFWVWTETFIQTIYILQHQQPVHRLKMENLMSRCTNKTTQTTMDTTLTTTFGILAKTLMHTICHLQHEQPAFRFKAKTLILLSQTTIFFDWQQECFDSEY